MGGRVIPPDGFDPKIITIDLGSGLWVYKLQGSDPYSHYRKGYSSHMGHPWTPLIRETPTLYAAHAGMTWEEVLAMCTLGY